ncbi:MAG: hypothetical protein RLZZ618_3508 [Pseudomonadota bacterium]
MIRLVPRSLFGRNLLLIALLILAANVAGAVLFRELVMKPRVRALADTTVRHVEALSRGLRLLPPDQRSAFVDRFNAHLRSPVISPTPQRELNVLEQAFVAQLAERAPGDAPILWQREPDGSLALQLQLEGDSYWINVPGMLRGPDLSAAWRLGVLATVSLAVLGAWLMARRINRPMRALVAAARRLGRGEPVGELPEDGPSEIATMAHGFNEMVRSLAQQDQERGLMLAGLSHDLRTPLAKMRLVTEMLEGDPVLLDSLNRSIETLDRLLSQFLDFTRSGQGGPWTGEAAAASDLDALVRDAVLQCPPFREGELQFKPGAVPPTLLRPQATERIIVNLLVNAQRHASGPFEIVTGHGPQGTWLEVRDRGPGIPPNQVALLKQPFSRADSARSGAGGAGLGLAIVERIARADNAQFDLLPREGGGLIARVQWPQRSC